MKLSSLSFPVEVSKATKGESPPAETGPAIETMPESPVGWESKTSLSFKGALKSTSPFLSATTAREFDYFGTPSFPEYLMVLVDRSS